MRRLVGLASAALLSLTALQPAAAQISVGARGGITYSHLSGPEIKTDNRARFAVGVFAGFNIARNIGLQPELAYVQKGSKTESEIADVVEGLIVIKQTTSLDYLQLLLPVDLTIKVNNEKVKPRLYTGPTFALTLNCKVKTEPSAGEPLPTIDCKDETKSLDFGLLFGFGLQLGAGPGRFAIDARYDLGLTNISDVADDPSKKNRSLQLLVGYVRDI